MTKPKSKGKADCQCGHKAHSVGKCLFNEWKGLMWVICRCENYSPKSRKRGGKCPHCGMTKEACAEASGTLEFKDGLEQ